MGKSDRAFAFGLIALLLGLGVGAGIWTTLLLGAMAALLILTIVNRARHALVEARE
jgi:CDP-diacylglycerol--glycerol-3-phosphate 3-phosphatidyltransferase